MFSVDSFDHIAACTLKYKLGIKIKQKVLPIRVITA